MLQAIFRERKCYLIMTSLDKKIVSYYKDDGYSILKISNLINHEKSISTIRRILLKDKEAASLLHQRARNTQVLFNKQRAYEMYKDGYSLRELGSIFNTSPMTIRRRILQYQEETPDLPTVIPANLNKTRALKAWHKEKGEAVND